MRYELVGLQRLRDKSIVAVIEAAGLPNLFTAEINTSHERKEALWRYVKNDWKNTKLAKLTFEGLDNKGYPINPVFHYFQEI